MKEESKQKTESLGEVSLGTLSLSTKEMKYLQHFLDTCIRGPGPLCAHPGLQHTVRVASARCARPSNKRRHVSATPVRAIRQPTSAEEIPDPCNIPFLRAYTAAFFVPRFPLGHDVLTFALEAQAVNLKGTFF